MSKTIKMGNDDFILYCRKHECAKSLKNDQLGRMIWEDVYKRQSIDIL